MRFKAEISLLLLAIILYIVSAFFYSYEVSEQGSYTEYAIPLAVVASVLLVIAAILYSKRK